MKKFLAILLCLCTLLVLVACAEPEETKSPETPAEVEYKLGMGIVVSTDSSNSEENLAQVDATVATVVLDAEGKIVACRIDAAQNKMTVTGGIVDLTKTFKTKMELGDDYNMAKYGQSMDWNGDGVVKEWYDQAKAFEAYVVGKTVAEVEAIETQTLESGYVIAKDDALLSAGCTIQITDFVAAVVKACKDEQNTTFQTAGEFTLGVSANSADSSVAATADKAGTVQMYSDFAATVVVDGKIGAALNDAIQPKIAFELDGTIGETNFGGTKRELKEDYHMAAYGSDNNGDEIVLEWYVQSAAFSNYVVGMTAAEVLALETQFVNDHYISVDEALLTAGCTMQITGIMDVVAEAVNNAR